MAHKKQLMKEDAFYGIFNDSFPPIMDGVTLTVENYVSQFNKRGLNPCVVTPWNPVTVDAGCRVIKYFSLPIQNRKPYRYGYPKLDINVWRRLRKTPFRILHSHCPFSSGRLAVYVKKHQGVPLVGTFHSKYKSDLEHSFKYVPWMVPVIMKRILDFFNACDEVWIPQGAVEETVRQYGYKGPLVVMENGIDIGHGDDIGSLKLAARRDLGIKPEELSCLFVGQHIWEKGIDIIADALREIDGRIPFRMNFVGNGYALDSLKRRIQDYGLGDRVKVNGIVTDREKLKQFYAAADLFLFPSFYDNAPLVLREAAACGTPALLLRNSTASEVITHGMNGFLLERSPKAYADEMIYLYNNRRLVKEVGLNARNTIVRSWDDVIDEVLDRYNTLLAAYHK